MHWGPERPNNSGAGGKPEICLEMNRDQNQIGEWNDVTCDDKFAPRYICQKYPTCKFLNDMDFMDMLFSPFFNGG